MWASSSTHLAMTSASLLNAGVGLGGGCLPKAIRAFVAGASELGADKALEFLREIDAINVRRRSPMVDPAREQRGGILVGMRVAVLGRPSNRTATTSATRRRWSPFTTRKLSRRRAPHPDLGYADSVAEACLDADGVLHVTEWKQFHDIDPAKLAVVVANLSIIDGLSTLYPDQ
jgi:UDPglucose 6-dehydrogenase